MGALLKVYGISAVKEKKHCVPLSMGKGFLANSVPPPKPLASNPIRRGIRVSFLPPERL